MALVDHCSLCSNGSGSGPLRRLGSADRTPVCHLLPAFHLGGSELLLDHQHAQDSVGELGVLAEWGDRLGVGAEVTEEVDATLAALDLVGEALLGPAFAVFDRTAVLLDHAAEMGLDAIPVTGCFSRVDEEHSFVQSLGHSRAPSEPPAPASPPR